MKLVIDSNVLFTFFFKDSVLKQVLEKSVELFSPEYALEEINKHSSELMKKTGLSKSEFKKLKQELALKVDFIALQEYSSVFAKALCIAESFSKDKYPEFVKDIDFFALALKIGCPIWSNDKLFKKQDKILSYLMR